MSGWRDMDGRTASDRRQHAGEVARRSLLDTLRNNPGRLVKPVLGAAFVALIVIALALRFF